MQKTVANYMESGFYTSCICRRLSKRLGQELGGHYSLLHKEYVGINIAIVHASTWRSLSPPNSFILCLGFRSEEQIYFYGGEEILHDLSTLERHTFQRLIEELSRDRSGRNSQKIRLPTHQSGPFYYHMTLVGPLSCTVVGFARALWFKRR